MKLIKSIGAILAGMITVVALSILTDYVLETLSVFPSPNQGAFATWMLILAFGYRCLYAVAGGYVAAKLAPDRPVRHAVILGIIGTLVSILGAVVAWDMSDHWYPVALIVTALPCTWLGSKMKK